MMRREAAQILAMVAWTKRQLGKIEARAKAEIDVQFAEEKIAATVEVDGKPVVVGYTQMVQPKPQLQVTDPEKFVQWVAERWPTEIVESVRESFLPVLKERCVDGILIDDQGEPCPFASLTDPDPYSRTFLTKNGEETLTPVLGSWSLEDLVKVIEAA
ncbi:hypothetical protein [Mycolicibacterium sphagni]|uniref:Uncharacterized protein n=1 Tax=Mycolicibacterium sphagni TaxID=1786 RepID=A0A255DC02_9MYCO|nr:hypothetical protein [Mycolicibacterium sphagni]OYN76834.1 hypothetical protein CG716_20180 [Mycolicibacterium sphagni]